MNKIFFLIAVCWFLSFQSFGQTSSCAQTLRLAQSTYEQGRLHEVGVILASCLKSDGFTTTELVQAYKMLVNSYIYLEEPDKADSTMLKLLRADPYFKPNEAVDPREFIALYKTFRVNPLFRVGFKVGPNFTIPTLTQLFSVGSDAHGNGKFSPKFNFSFAAVFEKDFDGFIKNFSIAPEFAYVMYTYDYTNEKFNNNDEFPDQRVIWQEQNLHQQRSLNLNLLVQYKFKETSLNPYFSVGPGISYLLGSTNELRTQVFGQGAVTGPAIDTKSSYNPLSYSGIFSIGSKLRFGGFYLTGDIRYQLGLSNMVKKSERSNPELVFDYGYVPSDYRLNSVTASIGLVFPYFNPIKLTK